MEDLIMNYTLKDIETIGCIIVNNAKENKMTNQEYIDYIIDTEISGRDEIRDEKLPEILEEIYDIVYHNLYEYNSGLDEDIKEEETYLRYRLDDSIKMVAFYECLLIIRKLSVIGEDLDRCLNTLTEVNKKTNVVCKESKFKLIIKKKLLGNNALAKVNVQLFGDSDLFRAFIDFVFDKDAMEIVENSLIRDKDRFFAV